MTYVHDVIADHDGNRHARQVVLHPGAVTIVALLDDGRVLLVRQYRHAVGEVLLELPAGTLDRQPDGSTEDPLLAAQRELSEETGHRADRWRELAVFYTAPGFANERMHLFLATGLTADEAYSGPAPDERLEVEAYPLAEMVELAQSGQLRDAKTLVGLLAVDALRRKGELT